MNHYTDGNLAAIESHLNERDADDVDYGTPDEHRALAKSLVRTDREKDNENVNVKDH